MHAPALPQVMEPLLSVAFLSGHMKENSKIGEVIVAHLASYLPCILPGKRVNRALQRTCEVEFAATAKQVSSSTACQDNLCQTAC